MRHKATIFLLAVLLCLATSVGVSANDLPFVRIAVPFMSQDTLSVDTSAVAVDSLPVDTAAVATDSLAVKPPKKEAIEAPVYYESTDSMVWSTNGNAFLYGSGKVVYDKIELTADIISMNMDSSVVHAFGRADSLGTVSGLPVFVDNGTP